MKGIYDRCDEAAGNETRGWENIRMRETSGGGGITRLSRFVIAGIKNREL